MEDTVCQSYIRLFLPAVHMREPEDAGIRSAIRLGSRPEFYDFDLFSQPGQTLELDDIPLTDLTFTVFDTETTGLDPKGGDEIISIGAIRIVNSRLLQGEVFDQLIDPKRSVPEESILIHGIRPEMLEGQLTIDQALPLFHAFAEGTILVAHNAAFDMRMLQLKEAATGIRFINPVLDTLLLSAVVHPAQENHNLEAICKRLGVNIIGRHTALGDAIATGEIFLKLIPLLINAGIKTLKDARLASQKTYYSRIKY
jgi:DNA polymerase-3 subunit epsilon